MIPDFHTFPKRTPGLRSPHHSRFPRTTGILLTIQAEQSLRNDTLLTIPPSRSASSGRIPSLQSGLEPPLWVTRSQIWMIVGIYPLAVNALNADKSPLNPTRGH
jgi:hypothetical protein